MSFVGSGGASHTLNLLALAVLPCSHTQKETQNIALLLSPDLLKVFVGSHCLFALIMAGLSALCPFALIHDFSKEALPFFIFLFSRPSKLESFADRNNA